MVYLNWNEEKSGSLREKSISRRKIGLYLIVLDLNEAVWTDVGIDEERVSCRDSQKQAMENNEKGRDLLCYRRQRKRLRQRDR